MDLINVFYHYKLETTFQDKDNMIYLVQRVNIEKDDNNKSRIALGEFKINIYGGGEFKLEPGSTYNILEIDESVFRGVLDLCRIDKLNPLFTFGIQSFTMRGVDTAYIKVDKIFKDSYNIITLDSEFVFAELVAKIIELIITLFSLKRETQGVPELFSHNSSQNLINIVGTIKSKLNQNIKFSLDELCKEVHISKSYLCHLFKNQTGKTIMEYVYELKIEKSKLLLLNTDMKIYEVSDLLCFASSTAFCKVFKKVVGMSPLEFKKNNDGNFKQKNLEV